MKNYEIILNRENKLRKSVPLKKKKKMAITFLQKLYLFAGISAVILAMTVPYWLPREWTQKKRTSGPRHSTQSSPFPFDLFSSSSSSTAEKETETLAAAASSSSTNSVKKIFTKSELLEFRNSQQQAPLYLVVLGEVFDVTSGERFYSPGKGYHGFVGQDNSAAFHTGKFNESEEDIRQLPGSAIASVVGWRTFFRKHATYKFVGVVHGLYYDENGMPTDALIQVEKATSNAAAGEEEDKRRAKLFPRCNMHFDGLKKETVVWCDGYRSEEDVLTKAANDKELRVLRMVHFTSVASGQEQQDCRCLRHGTAESEIGSTPFPSARVDYYFKEKGCDPNLPRCWMKNA
jgi:hypothetical protein